MTKHAAIYIRASQPFADIEAHVEAIRKSAARRGCTSVTEFCDRAPGAAKGRKRLPALAGLLAAVERGEVERVIVSRLSHLGCSLDSLLDVMAALHKAGAKLLVFDAGGADVEIGDLPAAATLLVQARQDYRREAILQGQMRAKMLGVRFGRPPLAAGKIERVKIALSEGQGVRAVARKFGISPAKASRLKAELSAPSPADPLRARQ